ncbi:MAG: RdgB/HAM1 family non-canonical purine NTP pyrophosphatase [Cyclobacteriaceae bacterium]|nr:RdgB/HAM1 family non-canonical purine NTP pyrophosphatase [Cyclobacteriaceae bacterium]
MKICFATHNPNKLKEVGQILGEGFELIGLNELGENEELPENQKTLEGNSREKAEYIYKKYGIDCFADDTGLEVYALDGEPGVYSARYAGPGKHSRDNIALLLENLKDKENKSAQFRTVITLIKKGRVYQFEGVVTGIIIDAPRGKDGFGYDPVFIPKGFDQTFAEMSLGQKNEISHRGLAIEKLAGFLKRKIKKN